MTSLLYAIDPGLRQCGLSAYQNGGLVDARLVKSGTVPGGSPTVDWAAMAYTLKLACPWLERGCVEVVCEFPKVYQGGKQKGDPADLLQLAAVVGSIAQVLAVPVKLVYPHEWKRQMTKVMTRKRAEARLSSEEQAFIQAENDHNVWDAVAIGLWRLGRFEQKRVIAR